MTFTEATYIPAAMVSILFIKTSSLGDVIHHMPAVTDARRHLPDARLSWLVEEDYAPLARLHPAIDEIIAVASRRWRRSWTEGSAWREAAVFVRSMRARRFDLVIDSQGLVRTALMSRLPRGVRHGYDRASVREALAARCYDVTHTVARHQHAIDRNRLLTGLALGYAPDGDIDFGLTAHAPRSAAPRYAVLLHGTARREKEWAEENWVALAQTLSSRGLSIVLPSGSDRELIRGERIAGAVMEARVLHRGSFEALTQTLAAASLVVGVDTGLTHLAAALGTPLVAVFTGTPPALYAPRGRGPIAVVGGASSAPSPAEVVAALDALTPVEASRA